MAGSLRGQLGVKSSPLCPTASKLTTQYLVLDHMNNHYKKLSKVKPSIDNTPPKSITQSQKMRDRFQRSQSSRPSSQNTDRPISRNMGRSFSQLEDSDIYDETYWGNPEDDEETNVMSIMKDVLKRPSNQSPPRKGNFQLEKTMGWPQNGQRVTRQTVQVPRPMSARSMGSTMNKTAHAPTTKPSGDVLEKRSHVFTEPDRPFTPRTLKSTRSSRLAEYKYYTAPKKSSSKKEVQDEDVVDGPPEPSLNAKQNTTPTPKPRRRPASGTNKLDVTQNSENTLMFETLQTRDMSRAKHDKTQMVPPLDISVDKDHMNWLQEQASKAQIRVKSARSHKGDGSAREGAAETRSSQELKRSGEYNRGFGSTRSWAKDRLSSEEEELKYVEFVKAVTQDVLDRGIFTNRVLLHAFENHIEKNKHHLEERKMRSLLAQLREDLRIPSEREANLDENNMGHSSRRSSGYHRGELSFEKSLAPLKTKTYDSTGLQKTGTTAWLSEDGETLRTTHYGETTDYNMTTMNDELKSDTSDHRSYSATLENDDRDVLTVTQALETYQLNLSKQDSKENHLARDYSNNSVVREGSKGFGEVEAVDNLGDVTNAPLQVGQTQDLCDSLAESDVSKSQKPDRTTPRGRRRRHRQAAQDIHNSEGLLESASQIGDDDRQSVVSVGKQSNKSGVVSPRSQLSGNSQQNSRLRSRRANKNFETGAGANKSLQSDSLSGVGAGEDYSGQDDVNITQHPAIPNGIEPNDARISTPDSKTGHPINDEYPDDHNLDHHSRSRSTANSRADGGYGVTSPIPNEKSSVTDGAPSEPNVNDGENDTQHADDDTNADDYDDDYEDDVADADDEDATTMTHRTSDDDF